MLTPACTLGIAPDKSRLSRSHGRIPITPDCGQRLSGRAASVPRSYAVDRAVAPNYRLYDLSGASCRQPRIGQALTFDRVHERIKTLQGMPLHVALIQPEGELVNIPRQMLRRNLMVNAVDSALQDGPNRFDAVRADRPTRVLTTMTLKYGCSHLYNSHSFHALAAILRASYTGRRFSRWLM